MKIDKSIMFQYFSEHKAIYGQDLNQFNQSTNTEFISAKDERMVAIDNTFGQMKLGVLEKGEKLLCYHVNDVQFVLLKVGTSVRLKLIDMERETVVATHTL
jgi:hypothetical protein